ncbi:MAG: hypothetical protein IPJ24_04840 [bacterium]|nr:hypothetical protein [bacterium]
MTCLHDELRQLLAHGSLFGDRMDVTFNAMTSGALLMMAALVAVGFLLAPGLHRRTRLLVGLAILVPLLAGVAMTMTRSAEMGLLAGAGVILLVVRPRLFRGLRGSPADCRAGGPVLGQHFLPPLVHQRLSPGAHSGRRESVTEARDVGRAAGTW